jgi:phage-related protein
VRRQKKINPASPEKGAATPKAEIDVVEKRLKDLIREKERS